MDKNIVIFGANGAIGGALCDYYAQNKGNHIFAVSRSVISPTSSNTGHLQINFNDEASVEKCCSLIFKKSPPDIIIVTNGALRVDEQLPEKSLKDISKGYMASIFDINVIIPALVMKHILPMMPRDHSFKFAALSARVGSISDNQLGGWYSYRASKSALNMMIKTASIECARRNPKSVIFGLHPGTVNSNLSAPFQSNIAKEKLFTPQQSAQYLAGVVNDLIPEDTGNVFAWDGQRIEA
ncbi:MAG: SDR family NAD(P)-dependent oxidoreductase [Alphaproteobacteria bacterium]